MMKGILVYNATIVTMDEDYGVITGGYLLTDGPLIHDIGSGKPAWLDAENPEETLARRGLKGIDATGKIVFPGLVNTHCHTFQSLLKGLGAGLPLEEWWPVTIGPAASALKAADVRYAALAAGIEALRSGTTTILDFMYAHPSPRLSDEVICALNEVGLRCVYARAFRDLGSDSKGHSFPSNLVEDVRDVLKDVSRLVRTFGSPSADGMIRIRLAPTAIWGVSTEALVAARRFANENGLGLTMHLCETSLDDAIAMERSGMKAVEFLDNIGFLGSDMLAVHCVTLGEDDVDRMATTGTPVSHNAVSNLYLGSGVAPVPAMVSAGVTVSLGTDGAASNNCLDMLETVKFTALLHNGQLKNRLGMTADKALYMATIGGAKALGMEREIGSLSLGKSADFFIYNPLCAKSCPVHDPIASLVFSSGTENVETVVVNGRPVLEDGEVRSVCEREVLETMADKAKALVRRSCPEGYAKRRYLRQPFEVIRLCSGTASNSETPSRRWRPISRIRSSS
ncbi:MAG TPA: amidohydrolase [Clostridia bacterium]|nr:amidohydrolase [Clostridia bacterium]